MTAMAAAQEETAAPVAAPAPRKRRGGSVPGLSHPGAGVDIDPAKLREIRQNRGLSRSKLAGQIGRATDTVAKYEAADPRYRRRPKEDVFARMCKVLRVRPSELKPDKRR